MLSSHSQVSMFEVERDRHAILRRKPQQINVQSVRKLRYFFSTLHITKKVDVAN